MKYMDDGITSISGVDEVIMSEWEKERDEAADEAVNSFERDMYHMYSERQIWCDGANWAREYIAKIDFQEMMKTSAYEAETYKKKLISIQSTLDELIKDKLINQHVYNKLKEIIK